VKISNEQSFCIDFLRPPRYANYKESATYQLVEAGQQLPVRSQSEADDVRPEQKYLEDSLHVDKKSFAKEELDLLAKLIGNTEQTGRKQDTFKLHLFGIKSPDDSGAG
jgi:hypothetical protein